MQTSDIDSVRPGRFPRGVISKVWALIGIFGVLLGYSVLRSTLSIVPASTNYLRTPYYAKFLLTNEGDFFVSYPQVRCFLSYATKQDPDLNSTKDFKVREGNVYWDERSAGLEPHQATTVWCTFTDAEKETQANIKEQLPVTVLMEASFRPRYWLPRSVTRRFFGQQDPTGYVHWDAR
jgi:hypothetical protein